MILWSLWVDKDLAVFEGRKEGAVAVCSRAGRLLADFVSFNGLDGGPERRVSGVGFRFCYMAGAPLKLVWLRLMWMRRKQRPWTT